MTTGSFTGCTNLVFVCLDRFGPYGRPILEAQTSDAPAPWVFHLPLLYISMSEAPRQPPSAAPPLPPGWLGRHPWAIFLLPMIVYMIVGSFEPKPPAAVASEVVPVESDASPAVLPIDDQLHWDLRVGLLPHIPYRLYPQVYALKICATCLAMLLVWPGYRTFGGRVRPLAVGVGAIGVVLWIALCHLGLEARLLKPIGLGWLVGAGQRSAFNPLEHLATNPAWAYGFLAIRFVGLAAVVPVIEEFFLRGFLMRYVVHDQWWNVPFGVVNGTAVIVGTAVPMLMHPGELLAALVWFSLVTWLMVRTRNIWDCVVAHAVTNFLLGVYVVASGHWELM